MHHQHAQWHGQEGSDYLPLGSPYIYGRELKTDFLTPGFVPIVLPRLSRTCVQGRVVLV